MTIDIMMPFYGDVGHFKAAVHSVQNQDDPSWRLVVIDDRYPDPEPRRFIENLADERIHYVLNPTNLGVSGNFQRSIDLADSEFVVIMGCDDVMLPGYISRMRALTIEHPRASYFQCGVAIIDDHGVHAMPLADRVKARFRPSLQTPIEISGENLATSLLRGNWTYFPSLCWRRSTLQEHGFRRDFQTVLDLALQLSIISSGGVLVLDDEVTFEYRRHRASASSWSGSGSSRFAEEATLFAEAADRMRSLGWHRAARTARAHWSSRLNAITQLPSAVRAGDMDGVRALLRHIAGATTVPTVPS